MNFSQFLGIVELRTKIVSFSSILLGTLIGVGGTFQPLPFFLFFLSSLFIDMGTTAWNTFYDFRRGVDREGHNFEKDKVLVHQGVPPGWAFLTALGLFALGSGIGLMLAAITSWWLVPLGAASLLVGFFYSGGPRPISTTPVGEVFAGGFLGTLVVSLGAWLHMDGWDPVLLLWSLPSALMIASILTVNNICDHQVDLANGRLTIVGLLGQRGGKILVTLFFLGAAAVSLFLWWGYGPWFWAALAGFSLLAILVVQLLRSPFSVQHKMPRMGQISGIFMLFTFLWAGLLGGRILVSLTT